MDYRNVRADLHNHLRTSSNFKPGDFDRAVTKTHERLHAGGVLGLINFADERYEDVTGMSGVERADFGNAVYVPSHDVLIVKGQEVPTKQGHVLVLGLGKKEHLKGGRDLEDSIREAQDHNAILIADHPFYKDGIGPYLRKHPELLDHFHGYEIHNGEAALWIPGLTPSKANFYATRSHAITAPDARGIAASDGHSFYELGKSWTKLRMPENYGVIKGSEDVVDYLKEGLRTGNGVHRSNARIGALDHIIDLAVIGGLSKVGIKL